MLRELARRLLVLPFVLIAVTLAAFTALSSTTAPVGPLLYDDALSRELRTLPRFVNARPDDLRARTLHALDTLGSNVPRVAPDPAADGRGASENGSVARATTADEKARDTLARLGGAALPIALPLLDGLSPERRALVALALRPIAARMGLADIAALDDGTEAATRWISFWEDRALDFNPAAVRRAVDRYAETPTVVRLAEVTLLDTLALESIFDRHLGAQGPMPTPEVATRMLPLLHHALDLPPPDPARQMGDVIHARQLWFAEGSQFRTLEGGDRALATLLETQYARWLNALVSDGLGFAPSHHSKASTLVQRGSHTGALLLGGIAIAWGLSMLVAIVGAASRRTWIDRVALVSLALVSCVTCVEISGASWAPYESRFSRVGPSVALGSLLALPLARRARRAIRDELAAPHTIAAWARGASWARLTIRFAAPRGVEALAVSLAHDVALGTSIAFVIENLSGVDGLGRQVSASVRAGDGPGMLGIALLGALAASLAQGLSELLRRWIDRRT